MELEKNNWYWQGWEVAWTKAIPKESSTPTASVLIHGFGACKEHWRHNQLALAEQSPCYAIDLIGFGESSQPKARLTGENISNDDFSYCFENWASQVNDFCREVVNGPVLLVGNSIGGVIALRTAQLLKDSCKGIVLINCAQRRMDDKRLSLQPKWMQLTRPWLKSLVSQRWLSQSLFRNAAAPSVIKKVLKQAYPSGANIDNYLLTLLHKPSQRPGAAESFRGFINLFDDYLAPDLMQDLKIPVDLIWGEKDPWEPVEEAHRWLVSIPCIRSLEIIAGAGHCPHDETPNDVNKALLKILQQAK